MRLWGFLNEFGVGGMTEIDQNYELERLESVRRS